MLVYFQNYAIIQSKHNDFKNTILNELRINNYEIVKQEFIEVNKKYITNFLREIH